MRSWQSGWMRIPPPLGRTGEEQLMPCALKSAYQPSDSIFMLLGLQASGLEVSAIEFLMWRGLYPHFILVSPVLVEFVLMVIVPPLRGVPEELAGGGGVEAESSNSAGSMGAIMYVRQASLTVMIWRLSHCVMVTWCIEIGR